MAYPSDLVRTKDWGSEVLTDADLEGQLDVIINWVMACMDASTGHDHSATANKSQKIDTTGIADGAVELAKIGSDLVRADYGLSQHTDESLQIDPSDTNPCIELTDGGVRVKVDDSTIERAAGGLQVKDAGIGAAKLQDVFGAWDTSTYAIDTIYQASTDGFVTVWADNEDGGGALIGQTDAATPPTNETVAGGSSSNATTNDKKRTGLCMPVKKDDYWKITQYGLTAPQVNWIPLGS